MRTTPWMAALSTLLAAAAAAEPPLRVGTSGDYAPFSSVADGERTGFDVSLVLDFAEHSGRRVEWVDFRWPRLEADLSAGRFDLAASGITVRPRRSIAGRFSVPLAESGAVVLLGEHASAGSLDPLNSRGVRIAVNRGGHLEQVARGRFPAATLVALPENHAVLEALAAGAVDAAVTDSMEAPHWQRALAGARALGPFTRDRKAWLIRAELGELAAEIDAWLLASEANGRLERRRKHFLPGESDATASPEAALVAAIDERLRLMPAVAAAKRRAVLPVAAPEREQLVIDAGEAAAKAAAERAGVAVPQSQAVRGFYRAMIEAAKDVQMAVVRNADFDPDAAPGPDLASELRPALLRIGERIATLLVLLPHPAPEDLDRRCEDGVREPLLPDTTRRHLCAALRGYARTRYLASKPAATGSPRQSP